MSAVQKKKITIDYAPRRQFSGYHARTQRHAIIIAHRRCGKTVASINDLIMRAAQTHKGNFAYIAPFYSQAKDVAWDYLKHYAAPLLANPPHESELRVDLVNDARIRLYGADNADRLRGLGFDAIVADEFADWRSGVYAEILRPALSDRQGWVTFIGTPKGKNEFWQLWQTAKKFRCLVPARAEGLRYSSHSGRRIGRSPQGNVQRAIRSGVRMQL